MTLTDVPPAEHLQLDEEQRDDIAQQAKSDYEDYIQARNEHTDDHLVYDQMFRGQVEKFSKRTGPWPDSSHFHVQAPYWLVSSVGVRLTGSVFDNTPKVGVDWHEKSDRERATKASRRVEWALDRPQLRARDTWYRSGNIRLIHGNSTIEVGYAKDTIKRRVFDEDPEPSDGLDDDNTPIPVVPTKVVEETKYHGLTMYPYEWDDIFMPKGACNLQPLTKANQLGSHSVIARSYQGLHLMLKNDDYEWMAEATGIDKPTNEQVKEWWEDNGPEQDRQDTSGQGNDKRERQQSEMDGTDRDYDRKSNNPEFEILKVFMPLELDDGMAECVVFVCRQPNVVLGAYRLTDLVCTGVRPLVELSYQTVSNRYYSMGICEIVRHLSEELDTIHNMRVDVGQATNLPWFFYKAASNFNPKDIVLSPLKAVPIDELEDVRFPPQQSVTSFYYQEETLLLSLIERVLGVTDLFLGVSPTTGAASRHATGFKGTQQEAFARLGQIQAQDASAWSFLCELAYTLEMQYGPDERSFRLEGATEEYNSVTKEDIRMEGTYDWKLGANQGQYSQDLKMQKAQAILQVAQQSPLTNQVQTRRWELEATYYRGIGLTEREIEDLIGPKDALGLGEPKDQDEELNQMVMYELGEGVPSPVHPNDNDEEHLRKSREFRESSAYASLGFPNEDAILQHEMLHGRQIITKREQAMMQQQMQPQNSGVGQGQGANPENRANAQIDNVPPTGQPAQPQGGGEAPPSFPNQGL